MTKIIIGYAIYAKDDDSYMFGEDTFNPKDSGGFYDWRFGKNEVPHPATCISCGRKTDIDYVRNTYRVKKRKHDITTTYDGYTLVSKIFRDKSIENNYSGVEFVELPGDNEFFWLRSTRIIQFDVEKRQTRFEKFCYTCGMYFNVTGATPVYLKNMDTFIPEGFYRTDIEFGSGHEQHPIIIVGCKTADELRVIGFKGLELKPIYMD